MGLHRHLWSVRLQSFFLVLTVEVRMKEQTHCKIFLPLLVGPVPYHDDFKPLWTVAVEEKPHASERVGEGEEGAGAVLVTFFDWTL